MRDFSLTMQPVVTVIMFLLVVLDASINTNNLPPDIRRLEPGVRSINPGWTGEHSAALDGEQNKVVVSWTLSADKVEFQVLPYSGS